MTSNDGRNAVKSARLWTENAARPIARPGLERAHRARPPNERAGEREEEQGRERQPDGNAPLRRELDGKAVRVARLVVPFPPVLREGLGIAAGTGSQERMIARDLEPDPHVSRAETPGAVRTRTAEAPRPASGAPRRGSQGRAQRAATRERARRHATRSARTAPARTASAAIAETERVATSPAAPISGRRETGDPHPSALADRPRDDGGDRHDEEAAERGGGHEPAVRPSLIEPVQERRRIGGRHRRAHRRPPMPGGPRAPRRALDRRHTAVSAASRRARASSRPLSAAALMPAKTARRIETTGSTASPGAIAARTPTSAKGTAAKIQIATGRDAAVAAVATVATSDERRHRGEAGSGDLRRDEDTKEKHGSEREAGWAEGGGFH